MSYLRVCVHRIKMFAIIQPMNKSLNLTSLTSDNCNQCNTNLPNNIALMRKNEDHGKAICF